MAEPVWRTSSYTDNGKCVQVADVGAVLVRNSNHPDRGTLALDRTAFAAFVAGCAAGDLDDPA